MRTKNPPFGVFSPATPTVIEVSLRRGLLSGERDEKKNNTHTQLYYYQPIPTGGFLTNSFSIISNLNVPTTEDMKTTFVRLPYGTRCGLGANCSKCMVKLQASALRIVLCHSHKYMYIVNVRFNNFSHSINLKQNHMIGDNILRQHVSAKSKFPLFT